MTNITNSSPDAVTAVRIPDAPAAGRCGYTIGRPAMAGANASKRLLCPRGATTG